MYCEAWRGHPPVHPRPGRPHPRGRGAPWRGQHRPLQQRQCQGGREPPVHQSQGGNSLLHR